MEEEKDLEEIYSKSVSEIGKELFTEFLSDESRKRQTNLLLSSVIAILLSSTLIKPTQISIGVITTDSVNSKLLVFLSGLTCLYFIAIYILSIMQDLEVYKFRKMPLPIIWRDLKKKFDEANKEHQEEINKVNALVDERMKGRTALSEKGKELASRLEAENSDLQNGQGFVRVAEHPSQKTFAELINLLQELSHTTKQDGVDEALDQQMAVLRKGTALFRKAMLLLEMNEKYNRLNKIKMYIEVGFPISLGIVGIGSAIFSILK